MSVLFAKWRIIGRLTVLIDTIDVATTIIIVVACGEGGVIVVI